MEENKNEVVETTEETKVEETKVEETKDTSKKSEDLEKEVERYKKLLSKANSEAADYKKQLRSKMSDDEVKAAETESLMKELETFKTEKKVSDTSKGLMSWGLSTEQADAMARSLVDGDITSFIESGKAYFETVSQKAIADAMDKQKISTGKVPEKSDIDKAKENQMRRIMGLPDIK